jgi:hypothetical protein
LAIRPPTDIRVTRGWPWKEPVEDGVGSIMEATEGKAYAARARNLIQEYLSRS